MKRPVIKLSNGKKVMNFSSPHDFTFTDGSVLPAVSDEESNRLKILFIESPVKEGMKGDIHLNFALTVEVEHMMYELNHDSFNNRVDVVYCPLPMITAIRKDYGDEYLIKSPFRAIRMEDRIKKLVSIENQTL